MSLDILIAGHIVKDVTAGGWRAGGAALYAAAQASRLGLHTGVLTACEADLDPKELLPGVEWKVQAATSGTAFDNVYRDGAREQRLLARGPVLDLDGLPDDWRIAPIVFLAPVFHDLPDDASRRLAREGHIVGLGAQGWLRRLKGQTVLPGDFEPRPSWLHGDVVFVSEEDISRPEAVEAWQRHVPVVVLTRGRRGCSIWSGGRRHDFDAIEAEEVDPTGAGDVFAAAFLVRHAETREMETAARFAAAAAALSVRAAGIAAIANRRAIEALVEQKGP